MEERTRRLRTVIVITPMTMAAAAPIAMRAEMLRIFFPRVKVGAMVVGVASVEFGFSTIGLGRTVGQLLLAAAPQSEGLPETDEGSMVLKKLPAGSSPCIWLCEMLNN